MKSVILMCLFGFLFSAPHFQQETAIPTERGDLGELSDIEEIEIRDKTIKKLEEALLTVKSGEPLTQEDEEILSELLIPVQVMLVLTKFKHMDTEKLMDIGFDVETFLEEVFRGVNKRFDMEKVLKTELAGEDVTGLFEEALSLEGVNSFSQKLKKVRKKDFVYGLTAVSPLDGPKFSYTLLLNNGIVETRIGSEGLNGTSVMQGSFTIPLGNGELATFTWTADENGYRVESPHLPTPPPPPPHVAELLRVAEEQRISG